MTTKNDFELAELLFIGLSDNTLTESPRASLSVADCGGVILFSRNVTSFDKTTEFISKLQMLRHNQGKSPFLIAIDEEGGTVSRMPDESCTLPGARALAQTHDSSLISDCAAACGSALNSMGISINFAPVLDINTNWRNPGIGIRSFGTSADAVIQYSSAFISAMHQSGIVACAKHFPGKGSISKDSHTALPICTCSADEMETIHIKPFREAIQKDIRCIMTSHALYPALDSELPGTLSENILTGLLRTKLGYTGLIVSDDLEMGAMREIGSIGEIAYQAIMAGCDMALICHHTEKQRQAYHYLQKMYQVDEKFRIRCHESFERIQILKKYISQKRHPFPHNLAKLSRHAASQCVTCIKDDAHLLPLDKQSSILALGPSFRSHIEVEINKKQLFDVEDFIRLLRKQCSTVDYYHWDLTPQNDARQGLENYNIDEYDRIILLTNNAAIYEEQLRLAEEVLSTAPDRTILIPVKNPEDHQLLPQAQTIILTYGYNTSNIEQAIQILTGIHTTS